jgi:serine/threonine-protein kinase
MVQDDEPESSVATAATTAGNIDEFASTAPERDDDEASAFVLPEPGYDFGNVIGRGGMGEVFLARDRRIGRDVAIKRMRAARPGRLALARFLREAQIQARLDHPAIVPVHELGIDDEGRPYFAMKRLAGVTLHHRLADGVSQNRILRAFVEVCLAVEFAHSRGIVHRDLKPSNIMLGEYGEVYVLDWGVARIMAEPQIHPSPPVPDSLGSAATQTGALLGTPGYMAPEQVRCEPVTPAVDVYALGAILFEILAKEPLHPRGDGALASTLTAPHDLPSRRRTDGSVPPELDAVCGAALAEAPAERLTAHQLAERVEAYLDGDRDHERRRVLAAEHLAIAQQALATGDRAVAMRRAGRALALDPKSSDAAELVSSLMVTPPATLPDGVLVSLDTAQREDGRRRITHAALAYVSPFALLAVIPFMHVKSWPWLAAVLGLLAGIAGVSWVLGRRSGVINLPWLMVSNLVGVVAWSRLSGPFVLTPTLLCGVLLAFAAHRSLVERRWLLLSWGAVAIVLPFVVEWLGVLDPTWYMASEGLVSQSTIFGSGDLELITIFIANALFVLVVGSYASLLRRNLWHAQRDLYVQAWHLKQLLPQPPTA